MQGKKESVFEHGGQVGLSSFLQSQKPLGAESDASVVRPGDLFDNPLKGPFGDQKLGRPLILFNFSEDNSADPSLLLLQLGGFLFVHLPRFNGAFRLCRVFCGFGGGASCG